MAWICLALDNTLLADDGQGGTMPTDGAVEAMSTLQAEGHRLTVYTERFAPMPDSERNRMKQEIEQELQSYGFPPMEVWTGTTKPAADLFIGDNHVTFDDDWGLALAQAQEMLEERGLLPGATPDMGVEDPGAETPPEEGTPQ